MSIKKYILFLFLFPAVGLHLFGAEKTDFWNKQPKELADRYWQASGRFHEDWVLSFADSLDAMSKTDGQMHYYAAELRCHHAFNKQDSVEFFKYSDQALSYALEYDLISCYFGELFNVCSFYMNAQKNHEAQSSAQFLLSEASRLNFKKGAYYGYYAMGLLYSSLSIYSHAINSYRNAIEMIEDAPASQARLYVAIAKALIEINDYDRAVESALKAKELDSAVRDVNASLAMANFFKGDYDEFTKFSKLYLSETDNSSILYDYYRHYFTCLQDALDGDFDAAEKIANTMDDDTSWMLNSEICKLRGDWKGAYDFSRLINDNMIQSRDSLIIGEIEQLGENINRITYQYDINRREMRIRFLFIIAFLILFFISLLGLIFSVKNKAILRHKEKEYEFSKRYMMMVENSPLGFSRAKLIFDPKTGKVADYRTIQVNSLLHGPLTSAGVKIGEKTIVESYPESGPELIQRINQAISEKKQYSRFLFHLKEYHIYYETIIFFDSKDSISFLSLNTTDTVKAKKDAINANNIKTRFIQNMSHEIRTPLNAIVGFSQLLALPAEFTTDEEREEYYGYITNNSEMLLMLIEDILEVADAESGHYKMNISKTPCNRIAKFAMKAIEYRVTANVELLFSSDVDDDFVINTDARRVQQVLINYLTNACKNTRQGAITVSISTTENPGRVTFAVTDTGVGVAPDMAEEIFERFTKLDSFKQGAGLGLNICRNIANEIGAIVKLDTTYTGGARFVLII